MANDKQKLTIVLEGDSKRLEKALKAADRALKNTDTQAKKASGKSGGIGMLNTAFRRLAAYGAAGIVISGVKQFVSDSVKMAASLEGIERAFKSVTSAGSTSLTDLREATAGAVSDMELMRATVRASQFKIPLQNLANLFEFARIRAQQTGESVQYLTDSIVLGIGRKSPLILDNLGITMVRLKEAMGETAKASMSVVDLSKAVAKVAREETEAIKALGLATETTSEKIDKISSSLDNYKAALGKKITGGGFFSEITEAINSQQEEKRVERLIKEYEDLVGIVREGNKTPNEFLSVFEKFKGTMSWQDIRVEYLKYLTDIQKGQKMFAKEQVLFNFGDPKDAPDMGEWLKNATQSYEDFEKRGLDGNKNLSNAIKQVYDEEVARRGEIEKANQAFKDSIAISQDYKDKLGIIGVTYSRTGDKLTFLKEQIKITSTELDRMAMAGGSTSGQYQELKSRADSLAEALANLNLEIALASQATTTIDKLDKKLGQRKDKATLEETTLKEVKEYGFNMPDETADVFNFAPNNEKIEKAANLMNGLSQAFNTAITSGQSFGEIMIDVFKRILAQITATLAAAVVLSIITSGGVGGVKGILKSFGSSGGGGFAGAFFGGLFGGEASTSNPITSSGNVAASSAGRSAINVQVQGVMRGSDIYFSGQRGNNFVSKRLG